MNYVDLDLGQRIPVGGYVFPQPDYYTHILTVLRSNRFPIEFQDILSWVVVCPLVLPFARLVWR